jgi:putative redox protein
MLYAAHSVKITNILIICFVMNYTSLVNYLGNLRTECIHLRSRSMFSTDAPTDNNGKGKLFSPTDTLATSLASCMITVMGIRANKSGIPFNAVSADVKKIMASNPRRISEIVVDLKIDEDWTTEEKHILEKTAKNCPVALSLHPHIKQTISFTYTKS